jgi:hypothetical protein
LENFIGRTTLDQNNLNKSKQIEFIIG